MLISTLSGMPYRLLHENGGCAELSLKDTLASLWGRERPLHSGQRQQGAQRQAGKWGPGNQAGRYSQPGAEREKQGAVAKRQSRAMPTTDPSLPA